MDQSQSLRQCVAVELTVRQFIVGMCPRTCNTVKGLLDTREKRLTLAEQLQDVLAHTLAHRPEWDPAFFCYAVVAKLYLTLDYETTQKVPAK